MEDTLEIRLRQARNVVAALERGDEAAADRILDEIGRMRETGLFQEVCKVTRQLHDALAGFMADSRLAELTENDMPDARERLRYVMALTEQAATTTLNAVDEMLPLVSAMNTKTRSLSGRWERFLQRELSYQAFRDLSRDITAFLEDLNEGMSRLQGQLSEVLIAQGFQDLTGQIIRRVIDLVQQLEDSLIGLIRFSGPHDGIRSMPPAADRARRDAATGPVVPGADRTAAPTQDDVDELLSSLGF